MKWSHSRNVTVFSVSVALALSMLANTGFVLIFIADRLDSKADEIKSLREAAQDWKSMARANGETMVKAIDYAASKEN